ncbi:MAG: crossover junction endodeoxyribonuclease RuvC [Minisyncoccia bacterium]
MIVLGIDPGNVRAGYGLIKKEGSKLTHLKSGLIKIPAGGHGERLLALEKGLEAIIGEFHPDVVGLEKIFITKNKKTGIFVAEARGVISKIIAANKIKLIEFSPSSIKLAATGDGRADKKSVAKMVGLFLNMDTRKIIDDATDALAIAIAASSRQNNI